MDDYKIDVAKLLILHLQLINRAKKHKMCVCKRNQTYLNAINEMKMKTFAADQLINS